MDEHMPTQLPDNPAGRRCMDVMRALAKKMWEAGNEATNDFTLCNFPAAQTVKKEYADRKFKRTINQETGGNIIVIYDYKTQSTTAVAGI